MAQSRDLGLVLDLAAVPALYALFTLFGAGSSLEDDLVLFYHVVLAAGELLDEAGDHIGDLTAQIVDLVLDDVVDLVAYLIADPISQLAGQELVDSVVHFLVHDGTGTIAQLGDLAGDHIADGQQVCLHTIQHFLVIPAGADARGGIAGGFFHLLADSVHKGGVLHQLPADLLAHLVHGLGTQLGLEQLGVLLVLHDLVHGQIQCVIHQRVGQVVDRFLIVIRCSSLCQL